MHLIQELLLTSIKIVVKNNLTTRNFIEERYKNGEEKPSLCTPISFKELFEKWEKRWDVCK